MATELHWVSGPWPGKIAIAARPRGGDWLEDEILGWRNAGVDNVLSLLTPDEERDLDLRNEAFTVAKLGMGFTSFPIPDRQVPNSETELAAALERLSVGLAKGKNLVVHCRQGIGRSGLAAACLLVAKGLTPEAAVKNVSAARGVQVPETAEQRVWIDQFAAVLAR